MNPRLVKANYEDCLFVAQRMREWDRREIFATQWTDSPEDLAALCQRVPELSYTVWLDEPVAAFGAVQVWPGVFNVWFFATDRIREIGRWITRFMKRVWIPLIRDVHGAHRAHCMSMEGHTEAQKWLETLGAKCETVQPGFGKNGETFRCYCWVKPVAPAGQ